MLPTASQKLVERSVQPAYAGSSYYLESHKILFANDNAMRSASHLAKANFMRLLKRVWITQGFGKRLLNQKETDSVKRRKLGGKAAQEFQLLSDRNESRQEHFPSRSGNAAADPLPNAVRVSSI